MQNTFFHANDDVLKMLHSDVPVKITMIMDAAGDRPRDGRQHRDHPQQLQHLTQSTSQLSLTLCRYPLRVSGSSTRRLVHVRPCVARASKLLLAGRRAIPARNVAQPRRARLRRSGEGGAVDRDESEGRSIAACPLVVIQGAPVQVAANIGAVGHSLSHALDRAPGVVDAAGVVIRRHAILRHQDGRVRRQVDVRSDAPPERVGEVLPARQRPFRTIRKRLGAGRRAR